MGYDVDQTAVIISAATQKYGGGRAALTGLSDALKESGGDARKLEEALDMQSGSLDNATQLTGQYEGKLMDLANQEMEHKTILERIGAAWEDVSLSLSPVLSPLTSAVGLLGQVGSVGMSIMGLRSIAQGMREVTMAINLMRNAESLSAGVKAVFSAALGTETAAEEVNAAAKETNAVATATETTANEMSLGAKISATASNWALAISESAVLLPLILIVGAVLAVVGVLWYLYNNNEMVRNGINNLISKFWSFITTLQTVLNQVVSFVSNALSQAWAWVNGTTNGVNNLVNLVMTILFPFPTLISTVLNRILPVFLNAASTWISGTVGRARSLINQVASTLSSLPSRVTTAISGVANALTKPFNDAWNTISPIINNIQSGLDTIGGVLDLGFEDFGYNEETMDFGFNGSLNSSLSDNISNNNSTINNNFTIKGIVEESASEYIVNSVTDHIKKQNLIRGKS